MNGLLYFVETNAIVLGLTVLIAVRIHKSSRTSASIAFECAVICVGLFTIAGFFSELITKGVIGGTWFKAALLKGLCYFFMSLLCYAWFMYFEFERGSEIASDRNQKYYYAIPLLIEFILLWINLMCGIVYQIDENTLQVVRGPLYFLVYLFSVPYLFIGGFRSAYELIHHRNEISREHFYNIVFFPLLPFIAGIIQFFENDYLAFPAALSLSALLMYMHNTEDAVSVDPLTGLNNRRVLVHDISNRLETGSGIYKMYLCMIDVDFFKQINDTYGHVEGDKALKLVARALQKSVAGMKKRAVLARFGGDEFTVLLEVSYHNEADEIIQKMETELSDLCEKEGTPYKLTISIGKALYHASMNNNVKAWFDAADEDLYKVKEARHSARR